MYGLYPANRSILLVLAAFMTMGSGYALGAPGDFDGDGDVDLLDYRAAHDCLAGPGSPFPAPSCSAANFLDPPAPSDLDVDLRDFRVFSNIFNPPIPPPGDRCAAAIPHNDGEGVFPFTNVNATTDGLSFPSCVANEQDQIGNDIWYCWDSPCTGMVLVETCGLTEVDTKIAVYSGCTCPATSARLLGCDDDTCDVQSRATFFASDGFKYLIRIGNYPLAKSGSGSFKISCGFDACPANGSCQDGHATPGCTDTICCNEVCAVDPFCCEDMWDEFCAAEAEGLCAGGFQSCGSPIAGSCRTVHSSGGCSDAECCNAVCAEDTECCIGDFGWDAFCVEAEAAICHGACDTSTESCVAVHESPGCNNPTCCAQVCPREPFCCQTSWDAHCVKLANEHCN